MSFASIKIIESGQGMITDSLGRFELNKLCKGDYHIEISHIGFETEKFYLELNQDTTSILYLDHHDELLDEIMIHGKNSESLTQVSSVIRQDKILFEANNNLGDIAARITGVGVVKNGPGVSKPVIHGLSGNRLTILNNGMRQAGQRWGNDHAPEIDLFIADHIAVVKGVAGLEISGGSLGGVLEIDPGSISRDPHIHGDVNYIFQTNGRGHAVNLKAEKGNKTNQWRLIGTGKIIGDSQAPNYYLTNTGRQESNFAAQWDHQFSDRWKLNTYYSLFRARIAILQGSSVSNIENLIDASNQDEPYNTINRFSYEQAPPKQEVTHHLYKIENTYTPSPSSEIVITYGGQINSRDEFHLRRSEGDNRPSLSMTLNNQYFSSSYRKDLSKSFTLKSGLQYNYASNKNDNATTDFFPLVPDYTSHTPGVFLTLQKEASSQTSLELGGRYDFMLLKVVNINHEDDANVFIERKDHFYHNYSLAGGISQRWSTKFESKLSIGFAQRAPEVNETYSDGIHQSVAGYEKGDKNLGLERGIKGIFSNNYQLGHDLFLNLVTYAQYFTNYIYLRPDGFRRDIRGVFLNFQYSQTDAILTGFDLDLTYELLHRYKLSIALAYLSGKSLRENLPIIQLPSNNLTSRLQVSLNDSKLFKKNIFSIEGKYTFKQPDEVFAQESLTYRDKVLNRPNNAYLLVNAMFNTSIPLKTTKINLGLKVENLLNKEYTDYLDRIGYFARATGINTVLTVNYKF